MPRIAYVNGQYLPLSESAVHVEDRGYQFADGVYEVWSVARGKLADFDLHFERLRMSLGELQIAWPMSERALAAVVREVHRRNKMSNGLIYLQISRGVAPRDHAFPKDPVRPSIVITARPTSRKAIDARVGAGIAVISTPDERWHRVDIKSISLLPNVLAMQKARDAGAHDAWLLDEAGFVTEGTRSNAWIVDQDGNLVTRKLGHDVLPGITRGVLFQLLGKEKRKIIERAFTIAEAQAARETFMTSASSWVQPVVEIDGQVIGNGQPGSIARGLRELYMKHNHIL